MTYRVTKIICPSCHGSGRSWLFVQMQCGWCQGSKRMSADDAEAWAQWRNSLGRGGYLCGDHDLEDARRMEAEARTVFALLQRQPTWEREKAA